MVPGDTGHDTPHYEITANPYYVRVLNFDFNQYRLFIEPQEIDPLIASLQEARDSMRAQLAKRDA